MLNPNQNGQLAQCLSRPTATENLKTLVRICYRIYSGKVTVIGEGELVSEFFILVPSAAWPCSAGSSSFLGLVYR